MSTTPPSRSLVLLVLGAGLVACDAELRPIRLDREAPVRQHETPASGLHGHRDLQGDFESVWRATVEVLHARGVAVPRGARVEGARGVVDLEGMLLVVVQRAPGRICLEASFPGLDEAAGRAEAAELFDAIGARQGR